MKTLLALAFLALGSATAPAAETGTTAAVRTIVLVRHGHYAADPSIDEKIGPGLSPIGVAQARLTGARFAGWPKAFDARHVSPMQRARDTAASIGVAAPEPAWQVLDDLAECTPATRRQEVMDKTTAEERAACEAALERVFAKYFVPAQGVERNDLFVCHGNVIRYLVTRALGVDSKAWLEMSVGHASITRIRVEPDGRFKVLSIGDVGHLPVNLASGATGDGDRNLAVPALPLLGD